MKKNIDMAKTLQEFMELSGIKSEQTLLYFLKTGYKVVKALGLSY